MFIICLAAISYAKKSLFFEAMPQKCALIQKQSNSIIQKLTNLL